MLKHSIYTLYGSAIQSEVALCLNHIIVVWFVPSSCYPSSASSTHLQGFDVKVKWDAQLDEHGYEEETITNQRLLPSRWRKDREDGWRMDVAIDIESETDSVSEEEGDGLEDGSDTEGSVDDVSNN